MMRQCLVALLFLGVAAVAQEVTVTRADRTVDISTQLVKVNTVLTVSNAAKGDLNEVAFLITDKELEKLAHIVAIIDKKEIKPKNAAKSPTGFAAFTIVLPTKLSTGGTLKITVDYTLTQALRPFPVEILQDEAQLVIYTGSAYVPCAYAVADQKTTVIFGSGKMQSFTPVAPSKQVGDKVIYGPYTTQPALANADIKVHYENNAPFIVATSIERHIEVSHWGNIAVEEKIQLVHRGAQLTGPFSRLDFQMDRRGKKQPCVKEFKTILPASARDIYYRDVIGNISSSNVRVRADSVEVEIKPRFPLFGGWKTNYVIGYNLPSYEYLHADGNRFVLKMRLVDHVYDNMVVEKITTRIVLPELASDIKMMTPYDVVRHADETHATYLDWGEGRPVVVVSKESLVDAHIQPFTLKYNWQRTSLWREPLMASAFFFALFLAIIVYVRFDFTITRDEESEALLKAAAKMESYSRVVRERAALHDALQDALAAYKETKNEKALEESRKRIEEARAEHKKSLDAMKEDIKRDVPTFADRLAEIEKIEAHLLAGEKGYVEKAKTSTTKNSTDDRTWATQVTEAQNKIEKIIANL